MQKMFTEAGTLRLEGATMGTRWSVIIDDVPSDTSRLLAALQGTVDLVDAQMSTWAPASDLMRLNAARPGEWMSLPWHLMQVLAQGLAISRETDGAFEMNVGDAVRAWGFGANAIDLAAIRAASSDPRIRATEALHLDEARSRAKTEVPLALDLSGIAKGYGVDLLAGVLKDFGVAHALCSIDGEVRALGTQASGTPWAVAVERPEGATMQHAHSMLALDDGAVATSGDYRHFVEVKGHRLSHTIDPRRGAPRVDAPASVSVLAQSCMHADAMATALMVMGGAAGQAYAQQNGISALFLLRDGDSYNASGTGRFSH